MDSERKPVIVWFCLGLFALAEFGNVQMGGEIRRVCSLMGDPAAARSKSVADEIGAICPNRVPNDNHLLRLEARQARQE
jgi:hypothetical protein